MNPSDFNFNTDYPTDRMIYYRPPTSLTMAGGAFSSISFAHGQTIPFVPILRYSIDGGATWLYAKAPYINGANYVNLDARANNTNIQITYYNEPSSRTIQYEIYGIVRDV